MSDLYCVNCGRQDDKYLELCYDCHSTAADLRFAGWLYKNIPKFLWERILDGLDWAAVRLESITGGEHRHRYHISGLIMKDVNKHSEMIGLVVRCRCGKELKSYNNFHAPEIEGEYIL